MSSPWLLVLHLVGCIAGIALWWLLERSPWGATVPGKRWMMPCAAAVMAGFLFSVSDPHRPFDDFTSAYYIAGATALTDMDAVPGLYRSGIEGFVSLPVVAWWFVPLLWVPAETAAWIFFALGVAAALAAWRCMVRAATLDRAEADLLLFLCAANGPLLYSLREANTTHITLWLVAAALLRLRQDRDFTAGFVLGLAAILKLPLLLFGVFFALRGRWRAMSGGIAAVGATVATSVALFGWDAHVRWYQLCVAPFARNPIPAFNSQSIHAFIARLRFGPDVLLDWYPFFIGPKLTLLATTVVVCLLVLVAAVTLLPRRDARTVPASVRFEIEYLAVLVLAMLGTALAWSHYFAWLLLPTAFLIGSDRHLSEDAFTRRVGWTAVVLMTPVAAALGFHSWWLQQLYARLAVSHLLGAALLFLLLLIRTLRHTRSAP